jgi:hypothetical protein
MPGLGTATFAVTARDDQARAWFVQGLQLVWVFEHPEAVRVFRAALALDPSSVKCAWGMAYALGPNSNNPTGGRCARYAATSNVRSKPRWAPRRWSGRSSRP